MLCYVLIGAGLISVAGAVSYATYSINQRDAGRREAAKAIADAYDQKAGQRAADKETADEAKRLREQREAEARAEQDRLEKLESAKVVARLEERARHPDTIPPAVIGAGGPANEVRVSPGCAGGAGVRMIKRMRTCGLNADGFTPEMLCNKLGTNAVQYFETRTCEEIQHMLFD